MYRRPGSSRQWKRPKNTWVRPNSKGAAATAVDPNKAEEKEKATVEKKEKKSQPVLKGGPRKRLGRNTWKRTAVTDGEIDKGQEIVSSATAADSGRIGKQEEPDQNSQCENELETTNSDALPNSLLANKSSLMIKRGRQHNQLVLAKGGSNPVDESVTLSENPKKSDPSSVIMKKRGRNKLVLQNGVEQKDSVAGRGMLSVAESAVGASSTTQAMKRRGMNTLVLAYVPTSMTNGTNEKNLIAPIKLNSNTETSAPETVNVGKERLRDIEIKVEQNTSSISNRASNYIINKEERIVEDSKKASVKKYGKNKLVLINNGSTSEKARARKRPQARKPPRGPTVKRVKLNILQESQVPVDKDSTEPVAHAAMQNDSSEPAQQPQKLTEFAYREVSKKKSTDRKHTRRKKNLGWSREGTTQCQKPASLNHKSARRNMGLVRVIPDSATTPVCPIFARGLPCENEKCRKRHDVPQEMATPICSFFQRNGQCLKRDTCPFRHVKVDARTTVCPSFSLLGYCEDKECRMKHVGQVFNTKNHNTKSKSK